jgi:hypothetical protein
MKNDVFWDVTLCGSYKSHTVFNHVYIGMYKSAQ